MSQHILDLTNPDSEQERSRFAAHHRGASNSEPVCGCACYAQQSETYTLQIWNQWNVG